MAEFEVKQVSVDDLMVLKETILGRGPPDSLTVDQNGYEFQYRHFSDKKHFTNQFGKPYRGSDEGNLTWFHIFPRNDEKALNISWCEKGKQFSCFAISKSDLPEDAFETE